MSLVRPNGTAITSQEVAQVRATASREAADGVGYGIANPYSASTTQGAWFKHWPARLQSADRDWLPARNGIVARARDQFRNEPGAGAIVARRKNSIVGKGWRRSAKPNARLLNIDQQTSRELGAQIGAEWHAYAYGHTFSCDAERKLTFGQLLRVAAHQYLMDGEFLAVVEWAPDEPTRFKTRLRMVDPDRLSNPYSYPDTATLRGGVETDINGIPQTYYIREAHPADLGLTSLSWQWKAWPRFATPLGRPQVLHGFDAERASQTRGVTRFASALKSFRALSRYADATLQSAVINALILGYVQSSAGPEAVNESFTPQDLAAHEANREEFYKENPVEMGDAVFPVFPLGDEPKFATATKDVGGFEGFFRAVYRLICADLGVTYEEASMDYSTTNYSSARAALLPAYQETQAAFAILESQLANPFHAAWLEEGFDAGVFIEPEGSPSFYDAPEAYADGRWIGPARGYIDQTKEVDAIAGRLDTQVSTLEDECAEQGKDYIEVLDQLEYEAQLKEERGLTSTPMGANGAIVFAPMAPAEPASDDKTAPEDERPALPQPASKDKTAAQARLHRAARDPAHEAALDARPAVA